ncbi:MAG TPA: hypothetical protein VLF91_03705 [Candidatus Saccharimonadales bacterium]|nr:hypothetical protein [Candidatus Saccharimonadales bacterium]
MYFISSDQHARSQAFDRLIACTEDALADPTVVLPDDAPDFRAMLAQTYLPNIACRRITTPDALKADFGRIALLPITEIEAARGINVAPVIYQYDAPREIDVSYYEEMCGQPVPAGDLARISWTRNDGDLGGAKWTIEDYSRFSSSTQAMALTSMRLSLADRKFRPGSYLIQYPAERLDNYDPLCAAANMLHEYQHVADIRRWGALRRTRYGSTATELKAYEITRAVLQGRHKDWGVAQVAEQVAELQRFYGAWRNPRYATDSLVNRMEGYGYA